MIRQVIQISALALAVLAAPMAAAEKVALAFGNSAYDNLTDAPDAGRVYEAARALGQAPGITAIVERNLNAQGIRNKLPEFLQMTRQSDGQVIVLSGRFATNGVETFFLPSTMPEPNFRNLYAQGIPLSQMIAILKNAPEGGVLILAPAGAQGNPGLYWTWGIGPLAAPEDVSIVVGRTRAVADLVRNVIPNPRRTIADAVAATDSLVSVGVLPSRPFVAATDTSDAIRERLAWDLAKAFDTVRGYESYLANFPNGANAAEARQRIRGLSRPTPQQVEAELNLSPSERRRIQANLTVLGFSTRGVDGIFGQGTRSAISDWQEEASLRATGYLTQPQINRLDQQATERRQVIQQARREADEAYWRQTGARGTVAGLAEYLEEFPDGIYANEARAALDAAEGADRDAWNLAERKNTASGYRGYLEDFPAGLFAQEANDRLALLQDERKEDAIAAEAALGLSPIARLLIERRLSQLDYDPGVIDGIFDTATRRAILRLQRDEELRATGYADQDTLAKLLSGGLQLVFD